MRKLDLSNWILNCGLALLAITILHVYMIICGQVYSGTPTSLSATYYMTGDWFRVLLVFLGALIAIPCVYACSTTGNAITKSEFWNKIFCAIAVGGIISVGMFADFQGNEATAHYIGATILCAVPAIAFVIRKKYYISLLIFSIIWGIMIIRNWECNGLYLEYIAFDSFVFAVIAENLKRR